MRAELKNIRDKILYKMPQINEVSYTWAQPFQHNCVKLLDLNE